MIQERFGKRKYGFSYSEGLEESMKGSEFVFDSVGLLVGLNRAESYTDSPKWLKNKKATIGPKK